MAETSPSHTASEREEAKVLGIFHHGSWNLRRTFPHDVIVSHPISYSTNPKYTTDVNSGSFFFRFLDTFNHPTAHWCFTFTFMIFIAISSFSQVVEVFFLHKEYPDRAHLKRNAVLKFSIVSTSAALGVVFGTLVSITFDSGAFFSSLILIRTPLKFSI
jgi:hypothetical protein